MSKCIARGKWKIREVDEWMSVCVFLCLAGECWVFFDASLNWPGRTRIGAFLFWLRYLFTTLKQSCDIGTAVYTIQYGDLTRFRVLLSFLCFTLNSPTGRWNNEKQKKYPPSSPEPFWHLPHHFSARTFYHSTSHTSSCAVPGPLSPARCYPRKCKKQLVENKSVLLLLGWCRLTRFWEMARFHSPRIRWLFPSSLDRSIASG